MTQRERRENVASVTPRPTLAGILLFAFAIPGLLLALLAEANLVIGGLVIAAALTAAAISRPS